MASMARYLLEPDGRYPTLASLPSLRPGDLVEIAAGMRLNEVRRLTDRGAPSRPITLRGQGSGEGRPLLDGTGFNCTGAGPMPRALLQVEGDYWRIENLRFAHARNDSGNGAGIRVTGSRAVWVRGCQIVRCDMGMMSDHCGELTLERCEVGFCGSPEKYFGYSHSLYLGGDRAHLRSCYIHDAVCGLNIKWRGRWIEVSGCWIEASNEGEFSIVDGDESARPDAHALIQGCTVISKPDRTGNHQKFIHFGQDMGGARNGNLYLFHNRLVAGDRRIRFVDINVPGARLFAAENLCRGAEPVPSTPGARIYLDAGGRERPVRKSAPPRAPGRAIRS